MITVHGVLHQLTQTVIQFKEALAQKETERALLEQDLDEATKALAREQTAYALLEQDLDKATKALARDEKLLCSQRPRVSKKRPRRKRAERLELHSYQSKALGGGGLGLIASATVEVTIGPNNTTCLLPVSVKTAQADAGYVYHAKACLETEFKLLTGQLKDVKCVVNVLGEAVVDEKKDTVGMVMPILTGTLLEAFSGAKKRGKEAPVPRDDEIRDYKYYPLNLPSEKRETACQFITWVCKELHMALREVHGATVSRGHNDISLQNVMIDATHGRSDNFQAHKLCLIDFGLYGGGWKTGLKFNSPVGWFRNAFGKKTFTSINTDFFQGLMCIMGLMMERDRVSFADGFDWRVLYSREVNEYEFKARLTLGDAFAKAHKSNQVGWATFFMQHTLRQCTAQMHGELCVPLRKHWFTDDNKKSFEILDKLFSPPYIHLNINIGSRSRSSATYRSDMYNSNVDDDTYYEGLYAGVCFT
jgi:hypothetical protein